MSVYAMGHGWTGALGTGRFDDHIKGHDDEEDPDPPTLLYKGDVLSAAAGWGHTALVTNESNGRQRLLMCGRPHDLQAILRLNRFPAWLRHKAVHYSHSYKEDERSINVTALAGRFIQWALNEQTQRQIEQDPTMRLWELAKTYSILSELEEVEMPNYDAPLSVVASAGLTAVLGQVGGTLYTMGLNNRGQCGIGYSSNNVWVPQQVMGLSDDYATHGREYLYQAFPVSQVALGLQHGYALCSQGNLYSWGKAERCQLGQADASEAAQDGSQVDYARHVKKAYELDSEERPDWFFFPRVVQIASGFQHGAALTESTNQVFVWGKNVLPPMRSDQRQGKLASDSRAPTPVKGLPPNLQVIQIACGSHHTAMLMEDGSVYAVGICTDDATQILFEPVCVVPSGIIDMPCRQFEAHFDRTTIVGRDGRQVLQFHLWADPELREYGVFTPFWADSLLLDNEHARIKSIHRGWLHTIVVTEHDDLLEAGKDPRTPIGDGRPGNQIAG
ncbi:regulator of chromosome condensation [Seminavis robusta]|uniref:Regulator of chromosome condensation n=1 Tax=Seminavis robusta TaxID=568900 RepID=A0A9N8DDE0_9STRA|nr:regulator of chromosome condensation [Seminavis robusta]|eukprot:Sro23_g015580.1 regulator of chromosome condensation (502) ;mRNA; r:19325-20830